MGSARPETEFPALSPHLVQSDMPGQLWPGMPTAAAARQLAFQYQLLQSERLTAAELLARQFRQIEALIAQTAATMPFWKTRLRHAGLRPGQRITAQAWANLSVLTRREAQEAGPALFAPHLPPGHGTAAERATSGSTGMPLRLRHAVPHGLLWSALNLRMALWHGMDFSQDIAVIRRVGDPIVEPAEKDWQNHWGRDFAPFATGRAVRMDIRLTPDRQLAWLRGARINHINTFPTNLGMMARHCQATGETLPDLRFISCSNETVPDALRALSRHVFGLRLVDSYSCEEAGLLAALCPEHDHYHVMAEGTLLEILRDDGRPCAPGETGRVVITPLHNHAMPLLRYEIGDLAQAGPPCPCGRTLPVITRILGRMRDRVRMPTGGERMAFWGSQRVYRVPAVVQHQVAQVALDTMEYRVVARAKLTPADEAFLIEMLHQDLEYPFKVVFRYMDEIPREPSGKHRDFRCEIPA